MSINKLFVLFALGFLLGAISALINDVTFDNGSNTTLILLLGLVGSGVVVLGGQVVLSHLLRRN